MGFNSNSLIIGAYWDDYDELNLNPIDRSGAIYSFETCGLIAADTIVANNSYFWDANGQYITVSGDYSTLIPHFIGCDSIVTLNLTINSTPDSIIYFGNDSTLQTNVFSAQYQWVDCDNNYAPIPGETDSTFNPSTSGTYALMITQDSCSYISNYLVYSPVTISELFSNQDTNIFPNPTSGDLHLEFETPQDFQLTVMSLNGEIVLNRHGNHISDYHFRLNAAPGMYLIILDNNGTFHRNKVILE